MKTYKLAVSKISDYTVDSGWENQPLEFISKRYWSKDYILEKWEKMEYKNTSLVEVLLVEFEGTQILETNHICFVNIDERGATYALYQEFGQYMIPKSNYKLDYLRGNLNFSEVLERAENKSFSFNAIKCFETEKDVKDYFSDYDNLQICDNLDNCTDIDLISYELLQEYGQVTDTALEGTCELFLYKGEEYVVLQDNTIITRDEDNTSLEAIFPY